MPTRAGDTRTIANDPRLFIEELGYDIAPDPDQPSYWLWTAPTDACECSFGTAPEALEGAFRDAVGQTMGSLDLSSEQWDAMSFEQQRTAIMRALGAADDEIQDVVHDVLDRATKYGFELDDDMVRGSVAESADL